MALSAPSIPTLLVLILGLVSVYVHRLRAWRSRSRGRPFPPGPPGLPVIGNMLNIPKYKQWLGFQELSAKYGNILHFRILGDSLVVLGSASVIMEYLDKRSANTSDRKESVLIELSGSDLNLGFMAYGDWWRRHRRAFWQYFRPQAVFDYRAVQKTMSIRFLGKLLEDPARFKSHMRYTFSSTLMKLLYDIQVADEDDEYIAKVERAVQGASGTLPGKYLVEVLPFLRYIPDWVPGAEFQKQFASWRAAASDLKNAPVDHVKEAMERQEDAQCIVRDLLTKVSSSGIQGPMLAEEEEVVKDVAAVAFEAGSDTTLSTLQTVFLAMALYPEVLKRVHTELDAVVGPMRLPDFSDKDSLVYVNAIIREASRWLPVLPISVPHCTTEDDELHGYFIPKGTVLMPNVWACMQDPEVYPEPEVFRPERFIRDGKLDVTGVRDPFQFTFGFGRRICPGRYFAESAVFINVAMALHVFDITLPVDDAGDPIKIVPSMTDGILTYPQDCRCTIKPRSPEAAQLILKSLQAERPQ